MAATRIELPTPMVIRHTQGIARMAEARGFSVKELKEAKLTVHDARKHGMNVDIRRSTKHDENVAALRNWISALKSPKRRRKRQAKPRT